MSRRAHHIAIGAHDVERVAAFYRDVFGLVEEARHDDEGGALRSIWLRADDLLIMIERAEEQRPQVVGVGAGPFIVVFATTPDERHLLEERVFAHGSALEAETRFTSYTRDPEGNRVGFSTWPEPSR